LEMEQEPRKATDVLLEIEAKVSMLLDLVRSQDLVIKILSNKLNDAVGRLDKLNLQPRIVVEAVQTTPKPANIPPSFAQLPAGAPDRTIPIVSDMALPQSSSPSGFRRNSRPETYAPKSVPQIQPEQHEMGEFQERKMPVQIPQQPKVPSSRPDGAHPPAGRGPVSDIPGAGNSSAAFNKNGAGAVMAPPQRLQTTPSAGEEDSVSNSRGRIPVMQRCVNKNSKAIFLADVEIVDLATGQPVVKTRTNGAGRWQAPLDIGGYRVTIQKRESITKEKMEAVQDIQVDGSKSKLELPLLIIKEKS
jgi:hypothetical protein